MLNNHKYTDKEMESILKSIIIIVDSNEQDIIHITDYFDKSKIKYQREKLNFGDYSFIIPTNPDYGILHDMHYSKDIVIERKRLDEIARNFCNTKEDMARERFNDEFLRSGVSKKSVMIETGCLHDIFTKNYRTDIKPQSFIASFLAFKHRYNISYDFVHKDNAGQFIYLNFYYWLRELLKG